MALVNIDSKNANDVFYRYKMPKMITKIEGRGNGIKTNIVNMVDIAKALARPPSYTTKYFGCVLGAQSKFDDKTGISLVNGSHDPAKLAALLNDFIKKYVQCYGCENPETEVLITKSQLIQLKCAACGFVSDVDMRDKLTSFIIKNPPVVKKSSKDKKAMRRAEKERLKEGEAADEEAKKLKFKQKKSTKEGGSKSTSTKKKGGSVDDRSPTASQGDEDEVGNDDDVQWQTDTSMQAAQMRIQEQLSTMTSEMVMLSTEENPYAKMSIGTLSVDPHDSLVKDLKDFLETVPSANELKSHLGSLSGTPQEVMNALIEALLGEVPKDFAKVAKKKHYLIAALVYAEASQSVLLEGIKSFFGKAGLDVVEQVALVLKDLYDSDVLEEEAIVEWYEKGSTGPNKSETFWKNVKPIVEWLQNAEEEE